jgi:hypothetical protein
MGCDSVTRRKKYLCRIVFGRPSSSSSLRLASSSCVSVCGTGSGGIDGSATNGWAGPHAPPGPAPPVLPRSREPDREVVYAVVGFLLCLHGWRKKVHNLHFVADLACSVLNNELHNLYLPNTSHSVLPTKYYSGNQITVDEMRRAWQGKRIQSFCEKT